MRAVCWGFIVILLIVFFWAVFIRQAIVYEFISDDGGVLQVAFSSIPRSMLVLSRCMAMTVDGACTDHKSKEPLYCSFMDWAQLASYITLCSQMSGYGSTQVSYR